MSCRSSYFLQMIQFIASELFLPEITGNQACVRNRVLFNSAPFLPANSEPFQFHVAHLQFFIRERHARRPSRRKSRTVLKFAISALSFIIHVAKSIGRLPLKPRPSSYFFRVESQYGLFYLRSCWVQN